MRLLKLFAGSLAITMLLCGCEAPVSSSTTVGVDESLLDDPSSSGHWVSADGGSLAMRLTVSSRTVKKGDSIQIAVQLRNTGEAPITVLRPFGDWYFAKAAGIKVWNNKQQIRYSGATPSYVIGANAFVVLAPGETIEDKNELSMDNFAGIEQPGTYSLRYDYSYDGRWDATAAAGEKSNAGAWRGTISSRELQVVR